MTSRILVVDDEPAVTDLISYNLRKAHYEVLVAADGRTALRMAREEDPDLILLDLMLPEVDGWDICRELRKGDDVPIIMITARGEEMDRVIGLELGADDYIPKPFSIRELLARIKAVLRRVQSTVEDKNDARILKGPQGLELDLESRMGTVGESGLDLTRLEFDLLSHLLDNAGCVQSREALLREVWGYDFVGDIRAVDSAIKRLRAKLRTCDPDANLIETVRGVGYRFQK
jgi:DNA-binding response OmpR family regulator